MLAACGMSLELHADKDVLRLAGRLDATGAPRFEAWLSEARELPSVWDLGNLEFLSSAGIRCLLLLSRRLRINGLRPRVVVVSTAVANTLGIAGLDNQWEIYPDTASALVAARKHAAAAVQDAVPGTGGNLYRIRSAHGSGTVTQFRAEQHGRPMLLRFDELGVAIGRGGFDAGPGTPPANPGELFAAGRTVFVRDAEGLTDYLSAVTPQPTFAWVDEAVRLEADSACCSGPGWRAPPTSRRFSPSSTVL